MQLERQLERNNMSIQNPFIVDFNKVKDDKYCLVIINDADYLFINPNNVEIKVVIKNNVTAHFAILLSGDNLNYSIDVDMQKGSNLSTHCADFSTGKVVGNVKVNLNEEFANCYWHLASLSKENDNKKHSVSIIHNSLLTTGRVDNYGVSKDESRLLFSGTSHIVNKAIKSKTTQNAKIMVFDPHSIATAKPILKIDENDVEASHSAGVGKISEEHLFYLTSRGLSEREAKSLITLGYLKPILVGFNEEYQDIITNLIEGKI